MTGTDASWEEWGKRDPYYGVLSADRFRTATIVDHRDEFFASGVDQINRIIDRHERTFGPIRKGSALDYGCGVGRLTRALAERFDRADGLDISPSMLAEARAHAPLELPDMRLLLADDKLSAAAPSYDFVICYIVLQHIPVERGMELIRALLARIAPGGGCMLHVSTRRRMTRARRLAYHARFAVPGLASLLNFRAGKSVSEPQMQMNEYSLEDVLHLFSVSGMGNLLLGYEDHSGVDTYTIDGRRTDA